MKRTETSKSNKLHGGKKSHCSDNLMEKLPGPSPIDEKTFIIGLEN